MSGFDPRIGLMTLRIEGDRPCGSCGYNLRGLTPGGSCPECGAFIAMRRRPWVTLATMPPEIVGRFRNGAFVASATLLLAWFVVAFAIVLGAGGPAGAMIAAAFAIVWVPAARATIPVCEAHDGPGYGFGRDAWLRRLAWILQAGWPAAAALLSAGPGAATPLAGACVGVGGLGIVLLGLQWGRLAAWTGDQVVETILTGVAGCALFGLVLLAFGIEQFGHDAVVTLSVGFALLLAVGLAPLTRTLVVCTATARDHAEACVRRADRDAAFLRGLPTPRDAP